MTIRIVRVLALVVLAGAFSAPVRAEREAPPTVAPSRPAPSPSRTAEPLDLSTSHWSRLRLFNVSYTTSPSPIPLSTLVSWTVTITDAHEQPVADARLTVSGGMPEHSHGLPTIPQVKNLGGGRYLIEGLKFHMPGAWVVGLRIKAGLLTDSVHFDLQL